MRDGRDGKVAVENRPEHQPIGQHRPGLGGDRAVNPAPDRSDSRSVAAVISERVTVIPVIPDIRDDTGARRRD